MTNLVINVPGEYISLGLVLQSALEQASKGKGKERHASEGEAYEDQIICEVARRVGLGYPLGQAVKKIYESQRIGGERGRAELLGAINYIAAAVIVEKEELEAEREEDKRDHEFLNSVFAPYAEKPKAEGCEEPEFKPGDAVEWNSIASDGLPAVYLREFGDFGHCVVRLPDGRERIVSKVDLRRAEANYPENPDSSPEFQRGDKVEVHAMTERDTWEPATIMAVYRDKDTCEWRYSVNSEGGVAHITVPSARVRPASGLKAEGCEALVERDAPQTREALFQHIVDCNPSTFGCVHKPTGEELAEMAEEEDRG